MKVIGITGGVGSGKSAVLSYMQERHHAVILKTDALAAQMQRKDGRLYEPMLALFDSTFLLPDGEFDRRKIADIVFSDREKLKQLEAIVHPAVKEETMARIREARERGESLFLVESALLFTDHYEEFCDEVWYIYVTEAVRMERLHSSRGYTEETCTQIMQSQMKEKEFLERCDFVVDNNDDFAQTKCIIDKKVKELPATT